MQRGAFLLPGPGPRLCGAAFVAAVLLLAQRALALVVQVPEGAEPAALPGDRVLCGSSPEGWIADGTRKLVKPRSDLRQGQSATVAVAKDLAGCAKPREKATLIVTGPLPIIDPASVTLWVDAGRLELRGEGLEGVRVAWRSRGGSGSDVCLNVTKDKGRDVCALGVDKTLPADPRGIALRWAPPGGRLDPDAVTYDEAGDPLPNEQMALPIGRLVMSRIFAPSNVVDVSRGEGRIELIHPEAASSVECGPARCEVTERGITVRSVPAQANTLSLRVHFQPRVFLANGDALDNAAGTALTILRCPMVMVSGEPLRNVDDLVVLVRLDKSCGKDAQGLRWTAAGETVEVLRVDALEDGVYALLWLGRIAGDRLTIVASRIQDGSVVAVARERTREAPSLQTTLSLPKIGEIDFIPNNRDALLTMSSVPQPGKLVPISVPGAYVVTEKKNGYYVRGVYTSAGYTSLRFAYRVPFVPKAFAGEDFGRLSDPVQRPIKQANVPAPISGASISDRPVVELFCAVSEGRVERVPPGTAPHIPFAQRDSCRLVIHRERIPIESGEQHLQIDVAVTAVGGNERPEAKVTHHLVLRHGADRDVIWIRGAKEQFDRINVRVTHVIDESQYTRGARGRLEVPSAQWTVVTENANFKFYATAAIPASLYRFSSDPGDLGTGPLSLNFGVLSRFTWLDSDGREGLVGLELGVMGMGLATDRERQLALVGGLGIAIPLGNPNQPTQAAVNIHAWASYSVGEREAPLTDETGAFVRTVTLNPWAFVFGPSITIGSVGTFL